MRRLCAKVAESLEAMAKLTSELDTLIGEIATAATEQSEGIVQVTSAVTEIDHVTQTTAAHATEVTELVGQLRTQAAQLQEPISLIVSLLYARPPRVSRLEEPEPEVAETAKPAAMKRPVLPRVVKPKLEPAGVA